MAVVAAAVRDDDTPARRSIETFQNLEEIMERTKKPRYSPLPDEWGGAANSNSWASTLIAGSGLELIYRHAIKKRGGKPWTPGWGLNPWGIRPAGVEK